jgi:hypothetical protein
MTWLKEVTALLQAAEKYAELTNLRKRLEEEGRWSYQDCSIGGTALKQKEAAEALLEAALELANWGK